MTKPAHVKALDPIIVGCIFKNIADNKVYIRVKKLIYKINYLTQFIELDPDTGYYINKFTYSQMTYGNPQKNQNILEILNQVLAQHQDQIVDMNAIFLRNLASKAQSKNKLDSRFQIFQEICEADIEIENCAKLIDFTKCSCSIMNQDTIHVLVQNHDDEEVISLRQYKIAEDLSGSEASFDNSPKKISIIEKQSLLLDSSEFCQVERVHQFDEKVLLVAKEKASILLQHDLSHAEEDATIDLKASPNMKTLSIINKTPANSLYCKENLCPTNQ